MRPRSVIGKNTVEALQSGMRCTASPVRSTGWCAGSSPSSDPSRPSSRPAVWPPWWSPESETITHHEPDLTLIGLRLVYERNL